MELQPKMPPDGIFAPSNQVFEDLMRISKGKDDTPPAAWSQ
jgi:hypothetical protein